jgi:enamine deaminase RidA (YjgF/YER057c/UK114 family)
LQTIGQAWLSVLRQMRHVLKSREHLGQRLGHFDHIHKVRREYFKPASTMVEVAKMTSPEYLIEMSAIAVV